MSFRWVHREPLKATSAIIFHQGRLPKGALNSQAIELLKSLTEARGKYLDIVSSPHSVSEDVVRAMKDYISLLLGMMKDQPVIQSAEPAESSSASAASPPADAKETPKAPAPSATGRLKNAIVFKWTDNVSRNIVEHNDSQYELLCILLETALWLMRHTNQIGTTISVDEEAMKDYFRSLRTASGILKHINDVQRPLFKYFPNTDFDERIVTALITQTIAETQEVTLERARLKNLKPDLIAAIAVDTRDKFAQSLEEVKSVHDTYSGRIKAYLTFKVHFYSAYALCYWGKQLFSEEKCGESVACFRAATADIEACVKIGKRYQTMGTSKQPTFDPSQTEFFGNLAKYLKAAADKAEHENGFIYTQKIPAGVPDLPAGKPMVELEPFELPAMDPKWNVAKFDEKKIPIKGQDLASDMTSSDKEPIKPIEQKETEGSLCLIA